MSILTVTDLNHTYGGREILKNVSFRLLKGEHVGLIGANGEGKSTFMNIITNKLMPDEGKIEWAKRVRVGYLDQHSDIDKNKTIKETLQDAFNWLYDIEKEMNDIYMNIADVSQDKMDDMLNEAGVLGDILEQHDFYMIDTKVEEIARAMSLYDFGIETQIGDLSGGQRSKVLLSKLLLQKPDILLLDEPTNYLDIEQIEWLKRYLQEYENAFILISHDISFLNSVINLIWHIDNCELSRYVGDYNEFERLYQLKQEQIESAYKRQQQEIAKLEDFVARNKARVATRNMAMSRQKKLDKMERIELKREKPKPEFNFKQTSATSKLIFETKDLVIGYDKPLTKKLNLRMERGDKILITGANGLGKSTLIKTILGKIDNLGGSIYYGENLKIGYFEQEERQNNTNTSLEEMWQEFPNMNQHEVRAALAKCGLTTEHIESKVMVLSGGEQAKVRLCKIINKETNILFLDEPTNHLDVYAKDELIRAFKEYKGAIIMISHDLDFVSELNSKVWKMEDFVL